VFGERALVHRCRRHKERNVCDLLPDRDRPKVLARIRGAWALTDHHLARERLELLASELDRTWPDAGASLREGMDDTLTLMRLGIDGQLAKTLSSTSPCESMIEIVRYTQRNVKRWQDGDMRKRWTAAGMLVAEQQFRRIIGYKDLAKLVIAIKRHALLVASNNHDHRRLASPLPSDHQPVRIATKVPRRSGQPPGSTEGRRRRLRDCDRFGAPAGLLDPRVRQSVFGVKIAGCQQPPPGTRSGARDALCRLTLPNRTRRGS